MAELAVSPLRAIESKKAVPAYKVVSLCASRESGAGEMAEWLKAHAWKACLLERVTWVRIPLSPPYFQRVSVRHLPFTCR